MAKRERIDFNAAKAVNPGLALTSLLGLEVTLLVDQYVGTCPLPQHTGSRLPGKFHVNKDTGVFHCKQCKGAGDLIALVAAVKELSAYEAARDLLQTERGPTQKADGSGVAEDKLVLDVDALLPDDVTILPDLSDYDRGLIDGCLTAHAAEFANLMRKAQNPELFARHLAASLLFILKEIEGA